MARVGGRDLALARELGAAVAGDRVDRVGLDVALLLGAVEDVVGRGVHDRRADRARPRRRRCPAPAPVDRRSPRLVLLGAVDVGPRRAVDDRAGVVLDARLLDGRAVGDVEVRARQRDRLVPDLARRALDVAAEHAAAAR